MASVGFTGTQTGMNETQLIQLRRLLRRLKREGYTDFHHGACIGADEQAHDVAKSLGYRLVVHPPDNTAKLAFGIRGGIWRSPAPYLTRNHHIVDESEVLIAAPRSVSEVQRSGTWATVRYARKAGKTIYMLER